MTAGPALAFPFPVRPADAAESAALVKQLGAPQYADRERATARLQELPAARPLLEEALRASKDADFVTRATEIIRTLDRKRWVPPLAEFFAAPDRLPADAAIGYLTGWPGPVDGDELWATALGYAEALKKRGVAYRNLYLPTRLAFYTRPAQLTRKRWSPEGHATMMFATLWQVPDGRVSTRSLSKAILLTRAPVEATIYAEYSVILADGDVTLAKSQSVLVLAAGKVTLNGPDDGHVVVIARGEITVRSDRVSRSVTLVSPAGVKTESGKPLPLNAVPTEDSRPVLRGLWSTPDHLGLEVKVADGGLAVTAVKSRSIAAKAGVRVGDVIERAGGEPVKASDELMRYYWRGAAAEECPLRLRRGKEAVEVKVRVDRPGR